MITFDLNSRLDNKYIYLEIRFDNSADNNTICAYLISEIGKCVLDSTWF